MIFPSIAVTNLIYESAQDGVIARAGGGSANATLIGNIELTRVTTVASPGDSVKLPPAVPGATMFLVNHGANAMQVFGQPGDFINDVAGNTGVPQMSNSLVLYFCTMIPQWYTEGLAQGFVSGGGAFSTFSYQTGLAAVGTTQGSGPLITAMTAFVSTASVGNTSVSLPSAKPGMEVTVVNQNSGQALLVFPQVGESTNGVANASVSVANNTTTIFYCGVVGQWWSK